MRGFLLGMLVTIGAFALWPPPQPACVPPVEVVWPPDDEPPPKHLFSIGEPREMAV